MAVVYGQKFGKCLPLSGTNQSVQLHANATLKGLSQATVMLWYMPRAFGGQTAVYHESTGTANASRFSIYQQANGTLLVGFRDSTIADGASPITIASSALTLNVWYHLALTFNESTDLLIFYINGEEVGRNTAAKTSFSNTTPAQLFLGYYVGTGLYTNCKVDDFRLYNVYKTQSQIVKDMYSWNSNESGLINHLKFEEDNGTTAIDSSPNAWNATTQNITRLTSDAPIANKIISINMSGGGLNFVKTSSNYVNVPHNSLLNFGTGDFSFSTLFYFAGFTGEAGIRIFDKSSSNAPVYGYSGGILAAGKFCFTAWFNSTTDANTPGILSATIFKAGLYHVVCVKSTQNGANWKMYIQGVPETTTFLGTTTVTGGSTDTNSPFRIGASQYVGPTFFWNGIIYSMKAYKKALTQDEVTTLFKSDNLISPSSAEADFIASWNFDEKTGLILPETKNNLEGSLINYSGQTSLGEANKWVDEYGYPLTA